MLQSIIRYLVLAILLKLSDKGIIDKSVINDSKVASVANEVLYWGSVIGAIAWSWFQKTKLFTSSNITISTDPSKTSTITLQPKPTIDPQSTGEPK